MPTKGKPNRPRPQGRPPGHCKVCQHPERARIELLLAGGAGFSAVARKFNFGCADPLARHWRKHVSDARKAALALGPVQVQALAARCAEESESVLDHHRATRAGLYHVYSTAIEAGDSVTVASVAGRLTEVNNAIARITGEIASSPLVQNNTVHVVMQSPEVQRFLADLAHELKPYPEALRAVRDWLEVREASAAPQALPALEHK